MITQIITNHIKEGHKSEYIAVSKAFCAAMVENEGALEATVYEVKDAENDVVNIVRWNSEAEADALLASETFRKFVPQLSAYFNGNETIVLSEI